MFYYFGCLGAQRKGMVIIMRIPIMGGFNNALFNANVVNQKVNKLNENNTPEQRALFIRRENRDSIFISKQGKKESIIQQLMNQKQFIQESKNAEMQRGFEAGYMNEEKLSEYDEQLEMIDQQIAEVTAQQYSDEEKSKANSADNKVMSEEEYEQAKMNSMMSMALGIEQAEVISSVKEDLDGEARVLKAEIKSDGSKALESKKERVAEIEQQSGNLLEQIGNKIADITEDIKENQDHISVDNDSNETTHTQNIVKEEEKPDSEELLYEDIDKISGQGERE